MNLMNRVFYAPFNLAYMRDVVYKGLLVIFRKEIQLEFGHEKHSLDISLYFPELD
jgi:hypothetical protein